MALTKDELKKVQEINEIHGRVRAGIDECRDMMTRNEAAGQPVAARNERRARKILGR